MDRYFAVCRGKVLFAPAYFGSGGLTQVGFTLERLSLQKIHVNLTWWKVKHTVIPQTFPTEGLADGLRTQGRLETDTEETDTEERQKKEGRHHENELG